MELQEKAKILVDFIDFCKESMRIDQLPKINFIKNRNWVLQNRTFGQYKNEQRALVVYIGNRNLADICRTLAHELCHHRQNELGMLDAHSGETGSPIENKAHEVAGIIMREYGKIQPLIYENVKK
jgi:Zn-dependent peptidase ImmA (M78 family)